MYSDAVQYRVEVTAWPVIPCCARSCTYTDLVTHLSDWPDFDPFDRTTYPTVDGPVQVKYSTGIVRSGYRHDSFPTAGLITKSLVIDGRYMTSRDTT
jgi:hypothetical protein